MYGAAVETSPLLLRSFIGILYQPWMMYVDDCGAVGGMVKWQGKSKYSGEACPSAALSTADLTWLRLGSNPGNRGKKTVTNVLSYGTAVYYL
jgi:hypothetical protein